MILMAGQLAALLDKNLKSKGKIFSGRKSDDSDNTNSNCSHCVY